VLAKLIECEEGSSVDLHAVRVTSTKLFRLRIQNCVGNICGAINGGCSSFPVPISGFFAYLNGTRKDSSALIDQIFDALAEQTVTVPGASTVELILPRVAVQIKELKAQRTLVAPEVEAIVDTHPLTAVLISMLLSF